jgi:DNA processing protein
LIRHELTDDAKATLLLCTLLAFSGSKGAREAEPLRPSEWNRLADQLKAQRIRPGELLRMDVDTLTTLCENQAEQGTRLAALLRRGGQLAFELERLQSLGIWVLTRSDPEYPMLLKHQLKKEAPPVLFGAGSTALLQEGGLAVVGSRHVDESGAAFATALGAQAAAEGLVVVSGGAQGVDRLAMEGALKQEGGRAIGVLSDGLEKVVREPHFRNAILNGRLALVSAVHPAARFTVGNAMARNKYIYTLARFGVVVASDLTKGGTRAGAHEVLKHRWVPLFVRQADPPLPGNEDLIRRGAIPMPHLLPAGHLVQWLEEHAARWSRTAPGPVSKERRQRSGVEEIYQVVWPLIEMAMRQSSSLPALASQLDILPEQLAQWLRRAEAEGKVHRQPGTDEYRLGASPVAVAQLQFELS